MLYQLHQLTLQLQSSSPAIVRQWQAIFAGWPTATAPQPTICLQLELVDWLPQPPGERIFSDASPRQRGILSVYQAASGSYWLHFHDGALVNVPLLAEMPTVVTGWVTPQLLAVYGRFEDVVFTSLAPLLRWQGLFFTHAFAASHSGRSALLVGASQSGKTTTGLALLNQGWALLANDVVALAAGQDGIYALPLPGTIGIRAGTFGLLPALAQQLGVTGKTNVELAAGVLSNGRWAAPSRVTAIFFPQIGTETAVEGPQNRAISLAHLLEESVDRWDSATMPQHIALLQALCQQATSYRLVLGPDVVNISPLLESYLDGFGLTN